MLIGATRTCFVTKQGQESKHRKIRYLENRTRRRNVNVFYGKVNRITSRDYSHIFDTDFVSLAHDDRFPSLLYGSGATCFKIGLSYGGAASSFIPICRFIYFLDKMFFDFFFFEPFSILRQYSLLKIDDVVERAGESLCNWLQVLICGQDKESRHSIKTILFTSHKSLRGLEKLNPARTIDTLADGS